MSLLRFRSSAKSKELTSSAARADNYFPGRVRVRDYSLVLWGIYPGDELEIEPISGTSKEGLLLYGRDSYFIIAPQSAHLSLPAVGRIRLLHRHF